MIILINLVEYYPINRLPNLACNFLTCAKAEIKDLTVCIVENEEKFQSHAMTMTLIGHLFSSKHLFCSVSFLIEIPLTQILTHYVLRRRHDLGLSVPF